MIFQVIIGSFCGGALRGLVGFIKNQLSYKNSSFKTDYFILMVVLSGSVGLAATIAIREFGFLWMGHFSPALAFIVGYAGGDFIENVYKIIIKKSELFK